MQALAMDMGGSHIGCAVVRDNSILAETHIDCEALDGLRQMLPILKDAFTGLLHEAGTTLAECHGIAAGYPGIVDARTNTVYSTFRKYADVIELDFPRWCRDTFGLPLRMENDARMHLLGEAYAGAARGYTDVIMITLGTGIGGAAMMDGRLVRGKHANAACCGGHLTVNFRGRPCPCNNIGCAEAEAGGWSLPEIVREWSGFARSALTHVERISFRTVFEEAARGDTVAREVREHCLEVWSANAVSNALAYDPELIVIGGGVMQSGDIIVPFVQDYINRHAWIGWGKPQVRPARLGNNAGFLGAVPLLSEFAE